MLRFHLAATLVALAAPAAAGAVTVDFEAQSGPTTPAYVAPGAKPQTLAISGATFTGGEVVVGTEDFLDPDNGDLTAAYTTAPYSGFGNPLSISLAAAASSISFEVVNNIAGTYQVSVNGGAAQNYTLGDYANQTITLTGAAISRVTIGYQTSTNPNPFAPAFDFAIDNVAFTAAATAAVPEAATWATMILGLMVTGAALRRRRSMTAAFRLA